eukprot:GHRR01011595.1.p1 GENE.GHRR01011595.1~~GHRR01011595.1.p1  ORF type:complete len:715 (+),score=197.61 GHRR01011595.1:822-2966(+)
MASKAESAHRYNSMHGQHGLISVMSPHYAHCSEHFSTFKCLAFFAVRHFLFCCLLIPPPPPKVLRRQHNCSLPVEIAYRGDREVDQQTRETLVAAFAPLTWLNLEQQPYPTHHNQDYTMDRYEPKIYALYHTRFQQVLLLDADNLPLRDPTYLFDSPHMCRHGNMFWLDLWSPLLSSTTFVGHDSVYPLIGINKGPYWDALAAGQGHIRRVAESGQVLLDRVRHADVLEYLWWLTSYSKELYKHILGDKDTFGFAFAAAKKLHELHAVTLPPGVAFKHQAGDLGTGKMAPPLWHFHAMLQYDHLGEPVFFHRTLEKWMDVRQPPALMDVMTGPVPNWFIISYMGNTSNALSPDIPEHTLNPVQLNCPAPSRTYVHEGKSHQRSSSLSFRGIGQKHCPVGVLLEYLQFREWGLPVLQQPGLVNVCKATGALLQKGFGLSMVTADDLMSSSSGDYRRLMNEAMGHELLAVDADKNKQRLYGRVLSGSGSATVGLFWPFNRWQHQQQRGTAADAASTASSGSDSGITAGAIARWQRILAADSSSSSSRFWPWLTEQVWLRNCKALRKQSHSGNYGSNNLVKHQRNSTTAEASSQMPAVAMPSCGNMAWHVARYGLPEYAETVARDEHGNPTAVIHPGLPVLLLHNQGVIPPAVAAAASNLASEGTAGSSSGSVDNSIGGCGGAVGPVCAMDVLQRHALPAALDWVNQHIEDLPYLKS